jgi:rod shape-determining protein MreC
VLDRSPPALFKQGVTAFVKLTICAGLSFGLMGIDRHAGVGESIRAALATALYPVQFALRQPMVWAAGMADFLQQHGDAITENQRLERALLESSLQAQRTQYLTIENQRLEALLELRAIQSNHTIAARVVAETPDTYAARVVIDRGSVDGVLAGAAVIDTQGVFGQVTTVYPFSSEVTLITDPNHATPVMNARTGTRAVLFGAQKSGPPLLEMRYVNANADVKANDVLLTSGIDGVYPPGLQVATVNELPDTLDANYSTLYCTPSARVAITREVLVIIPSQPAAPTAAETDSGGKP